MDLSYHILKRYNSFVKPICYSDHLVPDCEETEILTEAEEPVLSKDPTEVEIMESPLPVTISQKLREVNTDLNNITAYKPLSETEELLHSKSIVEEVFEMNQRVTVNMTGKDSTAAVPPRLPQRKNISIQIN